MTMTISSWVLTKSPKTDFKYTIYKSLSWPYFHYGDIAYELSFSESFYKNLESEPLQSLEQ